MERWKTEVDALTGDAMGSDASIDEYENAVLGSTPTGVDDDPQNDGERRINMLRGPPEAGGRLIPYNSIHPNAMEATAAATAVPDARPVGRWIGSGADAYWQEYEMVELGSTPR